MPICMMYVCSHISKTTRPVANFSVARSSRGSAIRYVIPITSRFRIIDGIDPNQR